MSELTSFSYDTMMQFSYLNILIVFFFQEKSLAAIVEPNIAKQISPGR